MAPNADDNEWERVLWSEDSGRLQELISREASRDALHKIERHIRQLHVLSELQPGSIDRDRAARRIYQLSAVLPELRLQMGGWLEQRAHDLKMLQWIRSNSALSVVLGAGATIAAGGPSWPTLVKKLLLIAIDKGREIYAYDETSSGARARVDRVKRLTTTTENEARQILDQIKSGSTDTELLKRGAQICADLFEESLFQKITAILYPGARRDPSRIHRSLATLAANRHGSRHGWVSIINYNFDSLMNEALAEQGVPYTCHFMANRKIERFGPRNHPNLDHNLAVIHLHGFTPRRAGFDISGIDFVFSTQQFDEIYNDEEPTIVDYAVNNYIRHPAYVALYVGCSFTDEAMNSVLRDAAERFPARPHYALVELPKEFRQGDDPGILERETLRYMEMGVRAIWYSDHDEIPKLLDGLVNVA